MIFITHTKGDPDCEFCEGEGGVEEPYIGDGGEVQYHWLPCECTLETA